MKINRIILFSAAAILCVIGLTLFCMQKSQVQPCIELPAPTGPFAVGTTAYHLIDKSRKESKAPNPQDYRELMVHIWYPSFAKASEGRPAKEPFPYLSQEMPHVKKIIFETTDTASLDQLNYLDAPVKTHSIYGTPVSQLQNKYPVLVFSHGLGASISRLYTSLLEDVASHGYIVVAIDHTYDNLVTIFPGNRVAKFEIPEEDKGDVLDKPTECPIEEEKLLKGKTDHLGIWVHDIQFVLDQIVLFNQHDPNNLLTSKFDLTRIGIFGHSWGGAAAAQVCRVDTRCKAGINIDGALQGKDAEIPFDKPFMILLGGKTFEAGHYPSGKMLAQIKLTKIEFDKMCETMLPAILNSLEILFNNLTSDAYLVFLKTADHNSFSDYPFLLPSLPQGTISPSKGIEITRKLIINFFDVYLKGNDRAKFVTMLKNLPEITEKIKLKN